MLRLFRHLLRIGAVMLIVTQLGGFACYESNSDIMYAAGYGYVVRTKQRGVYDPYDHAQYFVFETEQQARDFVGLFRNGLLPVSQLPRTYKAVHDTDDIDGLAIKSRLQPLPRPPDLDVVNRAVDQAGPRLPSGPLPQ